MRESAKSTVHANFKITRAQCGTLHRKLEMLKCVIANEGNYTE